MRSFFVGEKNLVIIKLIFYEFIRVRLDFFGPNERSYISKQLKTTG